MKEDIQSYPFLCLSSTMCTNIINSLDEHFIFKPFLSAFYFQYTPTPRLLFRMNYIKCSFLDWLNPASFLFLLCSSSIRRRYSNPQSSEDESPPITTRPGATFLFIFVLFEYKIYSKNCSFQWDSNSDHQSRMRAL